MNIICVNVCVWSVDNDIMMMGGQHIDALFNDNLFFIVGFVCWLLVNSFLCVMKDCMEVGGKLFIDGYFGSLCLIRFWNVFFYWDKCWTLKGTSINYVGWFSKIFNFPSPLWSPKNEKIRYKNMDRNKITNSLVFRVT